MRLRTARLDLRPLTLADVDAAHHVWTDPGVRRYLWDDLIIPREQAEEVIAASLANFREYRLGLWGIRMYEAEALAGFAGLRFIDAREVELLYGLLPEFWGCGLATEAAEAVLDYGFGVLALPRIAGRTDPPNTASIHVLERLGMQLERQAKTGTLPALCYSISRESFLTRSRPGAARTPPPFP